MLTHTCLAADLIVCELQIVPKYSSLLSLRRKRANGVPVNVLNVFLQALQ